MRARGSAVALEVGAKVVDGRERKLVLLRLAQLLGVRVRGKKLRVRAS